jgi:hypothetical protein
MTNNTSDTAGSGSNAGSVPPYKCETMLLYRVYVFDITVIRTQKTRILA